MTVERPIELDEPVEVHEQVASPPGDPRDERRHEAHSHLGRTRGQVAVGSREYGEAAGGP